MRSRSVIKKELSKTVTIEAVDGGFILSQVHECKKSIHQNIDSLLAAIDKLYN